jgi:hypothetical protein
MIAKLRFLRNLENDHLETERKYRELLVDNIRIVDFILGLELYLNRFFSRLG